MNTHRCEDCGTPLVAATGFGLQPTEAFDGRTHTNGGCVEYLKAARMGAEREASVLRSALLAIVHCEWSRACDDDSPRQAIARAGALTAPQSEPWRRAAALLKVSAT